MATSTAGAAALGAGATKSTEIQTGIAQGAGGAELAIPGISAVMALIEVFAGIFQAQSFYRWAMDTGYRKCVANTRATTLDETLGGIEQEFDALQSEWTSDVEERLCTFELGAIQRTTEQANLNGLVREFQQSKRDIGEDLQVLGRNLRRWIAFATTSGDIKRWDEQRTKEWVAEMSLNPLYFFLEWRQPNEHFLDSVAAENSRTNAKELVDQVSDADVAELTKRFKSLGGVEEEKSGTEEEEKSPMIDCSDVSDCKTKHDDIIEEYRKRIETLKTRLEGILDDSKRTLQASGSLDALCCTVIESSSRNSWLSFSLRKKRSKFSSIALRFKESLPDGLCADIECPDSVVADSSSNSRSNTKELRSKAPMLLEPDGNAPLLAKSDSGVLVH